jgi:hypothetical protein
VCARVRSRACVLRAYATIERGKREREREKRKKRATENKNIARAFDVSSLTRSYIKNIGGNPNEVNFVTAKRERKNDSRARKKKPKDASDRANTLIVTVQPIKTHLDRDN